MTFKDKQPMTSYQIFKEVLQKLNLEFEETVSESSSGLWCCWLKNAKLGWEAQGKGTSIAYCLASGYGELLERLQNLLCAPFLRYSDLNPGPFRYFPDEITLPLQNIAFPALLKDYVRCYENDYPWSPVPQGAESEFLKKHQSDPELCVPFYSYAQEKPIYLPLEQIRTFQGSNGLAAGNSYKEALVEGLSEILERWVEEYIFHNHLTPPVVPRAYLEQEYPAVFQQLTQLEQKCQMEITVFDCSVNQEFPVLMAFFADREHKLYKRSVGAHPLFEVALTRCLTESVQCNPIWNPDCRTSLMTQFTLENQENWATTSHYSQRTNRHLGAIPNFILYSTPSWTFKPWGQEQDYDNARGALQLLELCKKWGTDVFIRVNGFLGVPAVMLYIPGLSMLTMPKATKKIQYQELMHAYEGLWKKGERVFPSVRKQLLSLLESQADLDFDITGNIPRNALFAALLAEDGQFDKAQALLEDLPDEKWRCAAACLAFRAETPENLQGLLSYFYPRDMVQEVLQVWLSPLPSLALCQSYNVPESLNLEETPAEDKTTTEVQTFFNQIKKSIKVIDQASLKGLISSWKNTSRTV